MQDESSDFPATRRMRCVMRNVPIRNVPIRNVRQGRAQAELCPHAAPATTGQGNGYACVIRNLYGGVVPR